MSCYNGPQRSCKRRRVLQPALRCATTSMRRASMDPTMLEPAIFFTGTGLSSSAATGLDDQYATTSDSVCWNPMIFLLQPNFFRSCGGEPASSPSEPMTALASGGHRASSGRPREGDEQA